MLEKKIIENLKNGNYRIERRENDCGIYWDTWDNVNDVGCYYESVLIMDDLASESDDTLSVGSDGIIAINDPYFGLTVPLINANRDVVQEIVNAIVFSDAHQKLIDSIIKNL
jgi:hypothetical protein